MTLQDADDVVRDDAAAGGRHVHAVGGAHVDQPAATRRYCA